MKLELEKTWGRRLKGQIEKFDMQVGILEDKPHRNAAYHGITEEPKLKSFAGGPARKLGQGSSKNIGEILIDNMKRLNINLLAHPFKDENSDILAFTDYFIRSIFTKSKSMRRLENLLQAIVRNPILRQEYGPNKKLTADSKGFNRHLIDTGQMFKAIRAKVVRKRV